MTVSGERVRIALTPKYPNVILGRCGPKRVVYGADMFNVLVGKRLSRYVALARALDQHEGERLRWNMRVGMMLLVVHC